jgi:hypothetical protein
MRREVLWAGVGLDLDDPTLAAPGVVLPYEASPEERASGGLDRAGQPAAIGLGQLPWLGKSWVIVLGTRNPKIAKKAGMSTSWK